MLIRAVKLPDPLFCDVEDLGDGNFRLIQTYTPEWQNDPEIRHAMVEALFKPTLELSHTGYFREALPVKK